MWIINPLWFWDQPLLYLGGTPIWFDDQMYIWIED